MRHPCAGLEEEYSSPDEIGKEIDVKVRGGSWVVIAGVGHVLHQTST